jgi:hypothetical protein
MSRSRKGTGWRSGKLHRRARLTLPHRQSSHWRLYRRCSSVSGYLRPGMQREAGTKMGWDGSNRGREGTVQDLLDPSNQIFHLRGHLRRQVGLDDRSQNLKHPLCRPGISLLKKNTRISKYKMDSRISVHLSPTGPGLRTFWNRQSRYAPRCSLLDRVVAEHLDIGGSYRTQAEAGFDHCSGHRTWRGRGNPCIRHLPCIKRLRANTGKVSSYAPVLCGSVPVRDCTRGRTRCCLDELEA